MLKKLLKILLFPFFIFAFLYGLGEILGILFLATIFYGLLIYAIIQDPTFNLNKLLYFLGITGFFVVLIYSRYFYNENKREREIRERNNNPIEEDTEAMMSFNNGGDGSDE
jgi:hypothetical protein